MLETVVAEVYTRPDTDNTTKVGAPFIFENFRRYLNRVGASQHFLSQSEPHVSVLLVWTVLKLSQCYQFHQRKSSAWLLPFDTHIFGVRTRSWKLFLPRCKVVQIHGFLATTETKAETTPGRPTTLSPTEQTTQAGNAETTAEAAVDEEAADALGELADLTALGFSS